MATRKQIGWTVPGFGLPLRWSEMQSVRWQPLFQPDEDTLLLSALDASENPRFCYTVRERTMLALMNELTDMPDWDHPWLTDALKRRDTTSMYFCVRGSFLP
ncbi:MAG: hypothetical protein FRX48_00134 [Lasallia pustulata]|uniref:DUF4246 domain-containing protein n=1 Tax=Lasallia pustulata TaxID=136370 RepID=A0A5M8Q2Y1_9LECA|nr:MAG: hypothetical protein FRX48_00134 [Lasallia pustulata]